MPRPDPTQQPVGTSAGTPQAKQVIGQGFLGGSVVKNLPAMQETQVRFLCWEDPLEKGMATHSNILAWRIPWTEEPGRLWSMGLQTDTTEAA